MSKLLMKINSDPLEIIQNDLIAAMKEVGSRFERGGYFLT